MRGNTATNGGGDASAAQGWWVDRACGEYIVLLEDDYKSKVVMYRLKGLK